VLRRVMGKKKLEEMVQQRQMFRDGAALNGLNELKADEIFDLMEKFAGYGFNKSHSAAYALLAYHTGWVKVHYTAEFFCANMTVEMGDTDKLRVLVVDAKAMGIEFEPPDVNRGFHDFEPMSDKQIRYGLGAVKGTGGQAIAAIVAAREGRGAGPKADQTGPFTSLFDFCARVDRTKINKRAIDALIKAGAFDNLHRDRATLQASLERAMDYAEAQEANANQGGLFDADDSHGASHAEPELVPTIPWGVKERLGFEKLALGFFLTGHLFDESVTEVRRFVKTKIDDLIDSKEPQVVAGIVCELRVITGQRGKLGIFKLDDGTGVIEAVADEAMLNLHKNLLKDDELIVVRAKLQPDRFSGGFRLNISKIMDLAAARCEFGKYLRVTLPAGAAPDMGRAAIEHPAVRELTEIGEVVKGLPVRVQLSLPGAQVELQLGEAARFYPHDAALADWGVQAGAGRAEIVYAA
jgi:DNA polymerase III subunit alpha